MDELLRSFGERRRRRRRRSQRGKKGFGGYGNLFWGLNRRGQLARDVVLRIQYMAVKFNTSPPRFRTKAVRR
jgi:hypothetical protein